MKRSEVEIGRAVFTEEFGKLEFGNIVGLTKSGDVMISFPDDAMPTPMDPEWIHYAYEGKGKG